MTRSLTVIYTSTSGHTEHVVDVLIQTLELKVQDLRIIRQKAETTKAENLTKADVLLLACGTWNTGNTEGQLSPPMHELLTVTAAGADLKGMPCAAIGLGDERYYYTARAADRLSEFIKTHGGKLLLPVLRIVNEPYGQEEKVQTWGEKLAAEIRKLPPVPIPHHAEG